MSVWAEISLPSCSQGKQAVHVELQREAPSGQTLEHMNSLGYSWNPKNWGPGSGMPSGGILTSTVPGTVWGWDGVLHRFETMTFKETLQPAVDYTGSGRDRPFRWSDKGLLPCGHPTIEKTGRLSRTDIYFACSMPCRLTIA